MKYENEVTVEVEISNDELVEILKNNKFELKEEYRIIDIYMIKENNSNTNPLDMLKDCVLIRHVIEENKDTKKIVYKYKEYNDLEEIVRQGKVECKVESIDDAYNLLKVIGYKELVEIDDKCSVYVNETTEMVLEYVNNKHLYIEMEEDCYHIDRHYNSIEEMKEDLNKYNIPIKDNNYFAKKAEVEIREKYNI